MASQLKGKVAIVTGSTAGIGEAIALLLAKRDANVTFCGRDKDRIKSVLEKAVSVSGRNQDAFLAVTGDVNNPTVRKEIIERTVIKFGRLDILVANAGVASTTTSFLDDTEESYNNVLDTNLKSVFFLIQNAVPHLEKTKGNTVIISSIVSTMASPVGIIYSMSKVALDHLTRCLSVYLGDKGIRVNTVNPGFFPTLFVRNFGDIDKINEQFSKSEEALQPLKGRTGIVEDVAKTVAFMVSEEAGFITGAHVKVDGGRSYVGKVELPTEMISK